MFARNVVAERLTEAQEAYTEIMRRRKQHEPHVSDHLNNRSDTLHEIVSVLRVLLGDIDRGEEIRHNEDSLEYFAGCGVLPQQVSETGAALEQLTQVTICAEMSGGEDEVDGVQSYSVRIGTDDGAGTKP